MTIPKELILVRHGQSEHHTECLTGGWTDSQLTDRGMIQAEAAGKAILALVPEARLRFLSSDMLRTRQTAEIIAKHIGFCPDFHAELRELNNGAAKDKTHEDAKKIALAVTKPTVDWVPYPEAESWRVMTNRVISFLREIMNSIDGESILIVSHGNAMVTIVHWWLGLAEKYWSSISYEFACGSITRLSVNEWGERTIVKLNDTSHLAKV